jgi:endonuclease/exonuclease/phosphatase (EEP) superfamily protein YafD
MAAARAARQRMPRPAQRMAQALSGRRCLELPTENPMLDRARAAFLGRLLLGLLAAASLAGFAGAQWWVFDLFCHFRAQYAVAALLLALFLGALGQLRWVLPAIALAVVNLIPVAPLFQRPAEVLPRGSGPSLRLISFNVFGFNRQHERVLGYIRREHPDLLVLQEVTPAWMPAIRELAADYPHHWINVGDDVTGIAVLSRRAPRLASTLDLAGNGVWSYLLTFDLGGESLSVLGAHLNWPIGARNSRMRNSQLAALARLARAHEGALVIAGDLNITPFSPVYQRTLRDGGLRHCVPGAGLTPSWPARFPPLFIQIDHCLSTSNVHAMNFRVGPYLGSDHYPIEVEVAPADEVSSPHLSSP